MESDIVHQDQRIGLALAVLLLGAAGAFFFRNDPKPAASPRLKSARVLDAKIAEKQNAPYLQNDDEDPRSVARPVKHRNGDSEDDSFPSLGVPDSSNAKDRTVQELAPIPFPPGVVERDVSNDPVGTKTTATSERIHVVQKGETLSSIAAKELGSSGRYGEIFEANRDQLNDANDVRIGMSLRIPAKAARTDAVSRTARPKASAPPLLPVESNSRGADDLPPIVVNPGQQTTDRPTTDVTPRKKFEPAKRVPLGAQGLGNQSSSLDASSKTPRKMSQLPPKDSGGKVAR